MVWMPAIVPISKMNGGLSAVVQFFLFFFCLNHPINLFINTQLSLIIPMNIQLNQL